MIPSSIVTIEEQRLAEDGDDWDNLPDWQREALPKVREALESDRFLKLPGSFEIHEWSIMADFATGLTCESSRAELSDVLRGPGAFRMFKSTIRRLGIENDWYQHRAAAFNWIAKSWLEANNLPYREAV